MFTMASPFRRFDPVINVNLCTMARNGAHGAMACLARDLANSFVTHLYILSLRFTEIISN